MFSTVDLDTIDDPVSGPVGIVFSTQPRVGQGQDGKEYVIKGPDPEIVFAEIMGCLLASHVGIPVPDVALCRFQGDSLCGSCKVQSIGRNAEPWLRQPARTTNFPDLYSAIVVDAWLANNDRNMGNVIVQASNRRDQASFVLIDFEKSAALRSNPVISSSLVDPKTLWPTNELGQLLKTRRPLSPPPGTIQKIKAFTENEAGVRKLIDMVVDAYTPINWSDGSVTAVVRRGQNIARIAGEVWEQA